MTGAADFASGKGHRDENFPVASRLVRPELRPAILAFYRFVRAADDVADHAQAAPEEKLGQLARMEAGLCGEAGASPEGESLRAVLQARGLTDRHALDLLEAFRRDVTKRRYADWAELMDYCRYSAAPVGRFVLDVHGERSTIWPANDALCSALQVINHLQDCAKDYRAIDRVYIPLDVLEANGTGVDALAAAPASPALRKTIEQLARRTQTLLERRRHRGPPPGAGGRRHPNPGREPRGPAHAPRSLVGACPSPSGGGDQPGAPRRARRRCRLARAYGPSQAAPAG
jgi:hydroxysqualene synthase